MIQHRKIRRYLVLLVTSLICYAPLHALAEDVAIEEMIPAKPGMTELLGRILEDPQRDYQRVYGPDDCNSETIYQDTRGVLGDYVANPAGKKSALKDYIFSGEAACNCTRAIVGKNIDILMKDLGANISEWPCL
jgi:hypothetical protein